MPKVSVLVPLYRTDPHHLEEMISSVLGQTYKEFELILLNDSPDDSALRANVARFTDPRIRYYENPKNLGISASRNRLIELAEGEYLAIFDHDDICMPERLEKEVTYLDEHPYVGVVSGQHVTIPSSGKEKVYPLENMAIKRALMDDCVLLHPAAMIRKSVLLNNGIRYEEIYSPAEDYMLWVRLMGVTLMANLPDILIKYRHQEGNTSHRYHMVMADADWRIKCVARQLYPLLVPGNGEKEWISLFGKIPFIKKRIKDGKKSYSLFGCLPLMTVKSATKK